MASSSRRSAGVSAILVSADCRSREHARPIGSSSWSHPEFVYLTTAYPGYFAVNALEEASRDLLFVELDFSTLAEPHLYPDEDAIAFRLVDLFGMPFEEAAILAREEAEDDQDQWLFSLATLGNCAHLGIIPASAITRYTLIDGAKRPDLVGSMLNPVISPANFQVMGDFYEQLVTWTMGDVSELPQVAEQRRLAASIPEHAEDFRAGAEFWLGESVSREGISVVAL